MISQRHRTTSRGFTLVELLVVIAVIVILLALLVPGLNKALKYSEKSKCAANQRNMAQVLTGYSLNNRYLLPPGVLSTSKSGGNSTSTGQKNPTNNNTIVISLEDTSVTVSDFAYAMDYRGVNQANINQTQDKSALHNTPFRRLVYAATTSVTGDSSVIQDPLGLGILVATGGLPSTKLGEIAHCPSLNTKSAAPTSRFGMDEAYTIAAGQTPNNQGGNAAAGGSYYVDGNQAQSRIIGSYNYRATSYALKNGGTAAIQYSQIGPSFVLLADFPDPRYGKKYAHRDGYNVAYGDGHCAYYNDPKGQVEKIAGTTGEGVKYGDGADINQTQVATPIDGRTAPAKDEAIYNYLSSQK